MDELYRPNATVIVTDGEGRVLACVRVEETVDRWQTVQGGIDEGESGRDAAARELREELGLKEGQYEVINALPTAFRYRWTEDYLQRLRALHHLIPAHQRFVGQEQNYFLARVQPDTEFVLDGDDHQEFSRVFWTTPEELLAHSWEGKRAGLQAALRHFGLLAREA